jgi:hypothetical protein
MKYVLLGFAVICTTFLTGCMSQKAGAGLGAAVLEAALKPMFEPSLELARGANEFREQRKRWPKDYEELSSFLRHSDDRTFRQLQAVQFHSIHFSDLPDGRLRVDADYTARSGTKVRIEDMRITAFDPHDMN